MKERLDHFQKTPGYSDEQYDRKHEEDIAKLFEEAQDALLGHVQHEDSDDGEDEDNVAGGVEENDDEVDSQD